MLYRMTNNFLEVWFQQLDAWVMFYHRLPDDEHRLAMVQHTRELLSTFMDYMEEWECDALNNLRTEEKKEDEVKDNEI